MDVILYNPKTSRFVEVETLGFRFQEHTEYEIGFIETAFVNKQGMTVECRNYGVKFSCDESITTILNQPVNFTPKNDEDAPVFRPGWNRRRLTSSRFFCILQSSKGTLPESNGCQTHGPQKAAFNPDGMPNGWGGLVNPPGGPAFACLERDG